MALWLPRSPVLRLRGSYAPLSIRGRRGRRFRGREILLGAGRRPRLRLGRGGGRRGLRRWWRGRRVGRRDAGRRLDLLERVVLRQTPRRFIEFVDVFFQVGHFGFTHGLLELTLEFPGHAADFRDPLTDHAQDTG